MTYTSAELSQIYEPRVAASWSEFQSGALVSLMTSVVFAYVIKASKQKKATPFFCFFLLTDWFSDEGIVARGRACWWGSDSFLSVLNGNCTRPSSATQSLHASPQKQGKTWSLQSAFLHWLVVLWVISCNIKCTDMLFTNWSALEILHIQR